MYMYTAVPILPVVVGRSRNYEKMGIMVQQWLHLMVVLLRLNAEAFTSGCHPVQFRVYQTSESGSEIVGDTRYPFSTFLLAIGLEGTTQNENGSPELWLGPLPVRLDYPASVGLLLLLLVLLLLMLFLLSYLPDDNNHNNKPLHCCSLNLSFFPSFLTKRTNGKPSIKCPVSSSKPKSAVYVT